MKRTLGQGILILTFFASFISPAGARELWFSVGSGIGLLPGEFSSVSLVNIDGTVGLGIHNLFRTPLRSDVEITYAGYLASRDSNEWLAGMHGIQGVFLVSFQGGLGKSFVLTPRAGIGMQFLFTSSASSYSDYQAGVYTNRSGSQLLVQGGLAADFLLSEDWTIGVEGDYRMLVETDGLHHGALIKLVLNRKLADFNKKSKKPEPAAPVAPLEENVQKSTPDDTIPTIDLSLLQGIDTIRAFQNGKKITIVLHESFPPYEAELTEATQEHLVLVGKVLQGLHIKTAGFFGYVAEVQENEAELDKELSLSRAEAVRDWLFANGYLNDLHTSTAEGRSGSNPIADNSTSDGRALNRRVEIIININ